MIERTVIACALCLILGFAIGYVAGWDDCKRQRPKLKAHLEAKILRVVEEEGQIYTIVKDGEGHERRLLGDGYGEIGEELKMDVWE